MDKKSKIVLLVEDDKALNHAATFKLEQKGHTVISTMRAEDAFQALKDNPGIDIIWLDLLLPGMNGIEFLKELRSNPEFKDKKVVICSVSGRSDDVGLLKELGVLEYLVKSNYDINDLVDKVISLA
jgi:DNA-binding response OmpR family regulator